MKPAGVMRVTLRKPVNQMLPSAPAVIDDQLVTAETPISIAVPSVVMRPTLVGTAPGSRYHRLPSGPLAISVGAAKVVGRGNSVSVPVGVMRPMRLRPDSVNHRLPSAPMV